MSGARRFAAGAVLAALLSCSDRPEVAALADPLPDPDTRVVGCADTLTLPTRSGVVLNNMWNKASAGPGPWRQCLQSRAKDGRTDHGWFWEWPGRDGLYAYPEILVGSSPWSATPTNDPRFPRRLADTRALWVSYEVESRFSGKKNLAAEFWFTDSARPADAGAVKAELMIWTEASEGMISAKDKVEAIVDIGGSRWALHVKRDWGDASGGSGHRWTLITYVAMVPGSAVKYDAMQFFRDALTRGLLEPSQFIAGVELGNEIVSGSGSTWIRRFEVDVD